MKICVPAVGVPIDFHRPFTLYIGVTLCSRCFDKETAASWLDDKFKELVRATTFRGINGEPDFARAFLAKIPIDSVEWQANPLATVGHAIN